MRHKYVFIAGLHRSGTSLLHRLVSDYLDVSGFHDTGVPEDEGQHLQSVIPPAREFGGAGEFAFSKEAHMDESHTLANAESAYQIMQEWNRHWDVSKKILIEKSPPTLIRSRFFQSLFPDSFFIFISRHPIAVIMATRKWNSAPVLHLMQHWITAHKILSDDLLHIKNFIQINYEALAEHPDIVMRQIEVFLDLPHQPAVQEVRSDINEHYFEQWHKEVSAEEKAAIAPLMQSCKYLGYDISSFI